MSDQRVKIVIEPVDDPLVVTAAVIGFLLLSYALMGMVALDLPGTEWGYRGGLLLTAVALLKRAIDDYR